MEWVFSYLCIGWLIGSTKLLRSLEEPQFKSNTTKLDILLCILYWPVLMYKEVC